jgi:hypothetical protein
MFTHHLARLMFFMGFGLSVLPCSAQEGENVTLQFLSFPKSADPKPVELLLGDGKTLEVEIPTNELSKTYQVKLLGTWAVGKSDVGEDGKPTFTVFGQAKALVSPKQLILLVRKGKDNADGMEVIPIANDVANFGGSKFLFMNAAKVDIAGEAGGVKFAVKAGDHTVIKPKADTTGRSFHAMFYFRKDNEAKPFFSSKWPISDKIRNLIFFYHDPETTRLRMHTIRDFTQDG